MAYDGDVGRSKPILRCSYTNDFLQNISVIVVYNCGVVSRVGMAFRVAVMNQWTVPLEWNGGMEYWNDL